MAHLVQIRLRLCCVQDGVAAECLCRLPAAGDNSGLAGAMRGWSRVFTRPPDTPPVGSWPGPQEGGQALGNGLAFSCSRLNTRASSRTSL